MDNHNFLVVREFIEKCAPTYWSNIEWFGKTMQLYVQAQIAEFLDIKCAILNILLDRISAHVLGDDTDALIDMHLDDKIDDEFASKLHILFTDLTDGWDNVRTKAIIDTIKQWNAKPSFAKAIMKTCCILRLPEPSGNFLSTRHKLLHVGDLDPSKSTVLEYWKELDWLVLRLILRLFNYEGSVYHAILGSSPRRLAEFLTPVHDSGKKG